MNARATAALILVQVIDEHRSLSQALPQGLSTHPAYNEHSLIKELCYGVLRWHLRLCAIANILVAKPLKAKDTDIWVLLLLGLYQIAYMRIPEHAAVNLTVEASRDLQKPWAVKFINGVLRQYLRQKEQLLLTEPQAEYAHPTWLLKALQVAWPMQWQAIITANNQQAPMHLRVNGLKTTRDEYLAMLNVAAIPAMASLLHPQAITLLQAVDVLRLPKFKEGFVSVQDLAAQLAAPLLDLQPSLRVLDACAAPGGKTTHILELQADLTEVIAVDIEPLRLARIQENLQRLNLSATLITGDACDPAQWWDNQLFDRILLDAPCSATGVIRRHPDLKILRLASDIPQLAKQQLQLLSALWPLLKPGGILLYATCSVLPEENNRVIEQFLKVQADASEQAIIADWGIKLEHGRQILPGEMDGFYYAKLAKKPHP